MSSTRLLRSTLTVVMACLLTGTLLAAVARSAGGATPVQLSLNVLLIGTGSSDPTTAAWESALSSEGVAYTEVTATGAYGVRDGHPARPHHRVGGQLQRRGHRRLAGRLRRRPAHRPRLLRVHLRGAPDRRLHVPLAAARDCTAAIGRGPRRHHRDPDRRRPGRPARPEGDRPLRHRDLRLSGDGRSPAPPSPRGSTNAAGQSLAGVYQHPSHRPPGRGGRARLTFDYNATQLQWLLLAPGLINWVTQDTHLGLYRNYFGQDVDDIFIADNEWSSQYQCTPAATEPPDYTCPAGRGQQPGRHAGRRADERRRRGLRGRLGGADRHQAEPGRSTPSGPARPRPRPTSRAPTAPARSPTRGATYTDPGQTVDASYPNDAGAGQRPPGRQGRLQLDQPHLVPPVPRVHRVAAPGRSPA